MSRILAIDYGSKRTGIAVSDPLQLIANGLTTVPSQELFLWIENYQKENTIETIVVGLPLTLENKPAHIHHLVVGLVRQLKKRYPQIKVDTIDERFTSKLAQKTINLSNLKKKKRQDKKLIDQVSATIILQDYMSRKH